MPRPTGEGKYALEIAPFPTAVSGRLYNFDIDRHELKEAHKAWLNENVVPTALRGPSHFVILHGMTSRTGGEGHNLILSLKRAMAVADYLVSRGVPRSRIFDSHSGELLAKGPTAEHEFDRAVKVAVGLPRPIPPPPPPPKPPPKRSPKPEEPKFAMRLLNLADFFSLTAATFEIKEEFGTRPMTTYYEFRGFNAGFGAPFSLSLKGKWNSFSPKLSKSGVRADDFWGRVVWGSGPGERFGDKDFVELTLYGVPGLPHTFRPFKTGSLYAASIGGITGGVIRVTTPKRLHPYPGPYGR